MSRPSTVQNVACHRRDDADSRRLDVICPNLGGVIVGGIDLSPATIDGLQKGWITATLDQQLYLQGFLPVMQCVLSKRYGFAG